MRGKKKRGLLWVLCLAGLYLLLTHSLSDLTPKIQDITQVSLMRSVALDQGEEGGVRLTASGDPRREGTGGQTRPPLILKAEADSLLTAVMDLERQSNGAVEFGHVKDCVIGQEQAEAGIQGLLDFLERDFSMRLDTDLYLLREEEGGAAVEDLASAASSLSLRLEALRSDRVYGGRGWNYHVRSFLSQLADNGTALLPVLRLEENPDYDPAKEDSQSKGKLSLDGLCFFRGDRLGGILTREESLGAALLTDQNQLDSLTVELDGGTMASVQLVWAKMEPRLLRNEAGEAEGLVLSLSMKGDLNEIRGWADPWDPDVLREIEAGCCRLLEERCRAALNRSRQEETDFLHLKRSLILRYPLMASELEQWWQQNFSRMEIRLEVRGEIQRSYNIDRPMGDEYRGQAS